MVMMWGFPGGSAGKESAWNVGDQGLIPELGRSPGEGNGYPLQYSGLENSMDGIVHRVANSQTQLKRLSTVSRTVSDTQHILSKYVRTRCSPF